MGATAPPVTQFAFTVRWTEERKQWSLESGAILGQSVPAAAGALGHIRPGTQLALECLAPLQKSFCEYLDIRTFLKDLER